MGFSVLRDQFSAGQKSIVASRTGEPFSLSALPESEELMYEILSLSLVLALGWAFYRYPQNRFVKYWTNLLKSPFGRFSRFGRARR